MGKRYLDAEGLAYVWDNIRQYLDAKLSGITQDGGAFAFSVSGEGHLICSYAGSGPPGFYINGSGHLCLDI